MSTAEEIFGKARKPFEEGKHPRLRGRFARKAKAAEPEPVVDPKEAKKKEIFAAYQERFDAIDHATPITAKTTRAEQQKIMADRARAKGKLSIQMYNELKKLGETQETLYNASQVGDNAYLKPQYQVAKVRIPLESIGRDGGFGWRTAKTLSKPLSDTEKSHLGWMHVQRNSQAKIGMGIENHPMLGSEGHKMVVRAPGDAVLRQKKKPPLPPAMKPRDHFRGGKWTANKPNWTGQ